MLHLKEILKNPLLIKKIKENSTNLILFRQEVDNEIKCNTEALKQNTFSKVMHLFKHDENMSQRMLFSSGIIFAIRSIPSLFLGIPALTIATMAGFSIPSTLLFASGWLIKELTISGLCGLCVNSIVYAINANTNINENNERLENVKDLLK